MMSAAANIPVSEDLYRDISEHAQQAGVSPQEWISAILTERFRLERQTDDYFDRRASRATSRSLSELLDKAPSRPPDPGDEFEL